MPEQTTIWADDSAAILRQASRYYPLQSLVVAAMEAGADALDEVERLRTALAYTIEVTTPECEVCEDDAEEVISRDGLLQLICKPCGDGVRPLDQTVQREVGR
jgi:hypothetical protein